MLNVTGHHLGVVSLNWNKNQNKNRYVVTYYLQIHSNPDLSLQNIPVRCSWPPDPHPF